MESEQIQVRRMAWDDLDTCARIVAAESLFRAYGWDESQARQSLAAALRDPRAEVLVADLAGELGGFAWFVARGAFDRSGYLRLIATSAAARRRGVGRRLVGELEKRHLSRGGIVLLVTASNGAARRFYEGLGYRYVGDLPGYVRPELDECIYFKAAP